MKKSDKKNNYFKERKHELIILGIIFCLFLAHAFLMSFYDTDDAYISFRYARNLYKGEGLTFNPGQRVEGYTNFLWTVLMVVPFALRFPPIIWARLLSIFSALLLMWLLYRRSQSSIPLCRLSGPLLFACSGSAAIWVMAGLETVFFSLLIFWAMIRSVEKEQSFKHIMFTGLLALGAALTRPEALMFVFLFGVFQLTLCKRDNFWAVLTEFVLFFLLYGIYFFWRYNYYGYFLPNTFYAKTGGGGSQIEQGLAYLKSFAFGPGLIPLILMFCSMMKKGRSRRNSLMILSVMLFLVYVAFIGGDWMPLWRFMVPVLPIIFYLVSDGLEALHNRIKSKNAGSVIIALLLLLAVTGQMPSSLKWIRQNPVFTGEPKVDVLKELGLHLKKNAPPNAVIAVVPAGKIPFYSELWTIDMRGLLDTHIAHEKIQRTGLAGHEKRDPDYIMSLHPDYIVTTGARRKKVTAFPLKDLNSDKTLDTYSILNHPDFTKNYTVKIIELQQGNKDLQFYERKHPPGRLRNHDESLHNSSSEN